jgi:ribosomal protein S14
MTCNGIDRSKQSPRRVCRETRRTSDIILVLFSGGPGSHVHAAQPRAGETRRRAIFVSPLPPEHMRHVMLIRSRSSDNGLAESGDPRTGRLFRSLVEHSATMHRRLKPRAVTSQLIPEDTSYVARGHSASFVCGRARAVLRDVMLAVARGCLRDVPGRQRCALSMQHREVYRREGPPFGPLREKEHVNQAKLPRVVLRSSAAGSVAGLIAGLSVTCRPIARTTTRRKGVGAQLAYPGRAQE